MQWELAATLSEPLSHLSRVTSLGPASTPHRSPLCDCASSCSEAPADPEAVLCCPQQVLERQWTQVIKPGVHSCFSRHPLLRRLHLSDPMIDWFFFFLCGFSAFQQCRPLRKMQRYKIRLNKWPTVYFYVCQVNNWSFSVHLTDHSWRTCPLVHICQVDDLKIWNIKTGL